MMYAKGCSMQNVDDGMVQGNEVCKVPSGRQIIKIRAKLSATIKNHDALFTNADTYNI